MTVRIGVLGAARITPGALLAPAAVVDGVEVAVVAARDPERAKAFAAEHGIPRVASTYQEVVEDSGIDAVYNPLPINLHAPWTIAALRAGKHVLCEKPFSLHAGEAEEMVAVADQTGRLVVEAFHWRFHPFAERMKALAGEGSIGRLQRVEALFHAPIPDRSDIRYQLALGGGALMDLGCYAVQWVRHVVGAEPTVVAATAVEPDGLPGIDASMDAELRFATGVEAAVGCSMDPPGGRVAAKLVAIGSEGTLEARNPLAPHMGNRLKVTRADGSETVESVDGATTYEYQLRAFKAAVEDGTPVPTGGADAVATMRALDAIYAAAGLPPRG